MTRELLSIKNSKYVKKEVNVFREECGGGEEK